MPKKDKAGATKNKISKKEASSGYLPDVYKGIVRKYPDISKAIDTVAQTCQMAGPLDKKSVELIKLGMAIGINSEGAIRSHTRRAKAEGISPEEIRHVVLLAFTTCGFPHTIAAYKWVEEVLGKAEYNQEDSNGKS